MVLDWHDTIDIGGSIRGHGAYEGMAYAWLHHQRGGKVRLHDGLQHTTVQVHADTHMHVQPARTCASTAMDMPFHAVTTLPSRDGLSLPAARAACRRARQRARDCSRSGGSMPKVWANCLRGAHILRCIHFVDGRSQQNVFAFMKYHTAWYEQRAWSCQMYGSIWMVEMDLVKNKQRLTSRW